MSSFKKFSVANGIALLVAASASLFVTAAFAQSKGSRCPKDIFGSFTDAGSVHEGTGLDLSIGHCAITTRAHDALRDDNIWPTADMVAPVFLTKSDVMIGDLRVPAGKYSLYFLPGQNGWKLIVNKQTYATGYDESQDLGRVVMGTAAAPKVITDKLSIRFIPTHGKSCSGRCDPRNGPYVPSEELGRPEIHFVWGMDHVYVQLAQVKNSENAVLH